MAYFVRTYLISYQLIIQLRRDYFTCRCRLTLLQVHPISSNSLQMEQPQSAIPPIPPSSSSSPITPSVVPIKQVDNPAQLKSKVKEKHGRQHGSKKSGAVSQLPLHSVFPLFRPAGENYPEAVVPLEVDMVVHKMMSQMPASSAVDPARQQAHAHRIVLSLFECVGVVLGFSIRNSCPMGLGRW
jgi:hypothetical protein